MTQNEKWNDWKWQLANSIRTLDELEKYISLTEYEREALTNITNLPFSVTPFLAKYLSECENNTPLRMQFIPNNMSSSLDFKSIDYLTECDFEPVPNLLHKYEDRVAILTTNCCAAYCRHCTRSRIVGQHIGANHLSEAVDYIKEHEKISDILLTGGDPLILQDNILNDLLEQIVSIEHVRMIRIGTRTPISLPMRITPELINILKKTKPIYINIHINHYLELSLESRKAIHSLADAGFPLGSQSVLLKGINDNSEVLEELFKQLLYLRIKPYYIYQCDQVSGCEPFWVSPLKGQALINSLNGKLSGMAIPKYVVDTPGHYGKQIIAPCNLIDISDNKITLKNYRNQQYTLDF